MTRKEILNEAEKCVCGHREQDYGSPESNFSRIAKLWSAYMDYEYSAKDVAIMMALLKVARIKAGTTKDSYVDLAGYAACAGEIDTTPTSEMVDEKAHYVSPEELAEFYKHQNKKYKEEHAEEIAQHLRVQGALTKLKANKIEGEE